MKRAERGEEGVEEGLASVAITALRDLFSWGGRFFVRWSWPDKERPVPLGTRGTHHLYKGHLIERVDGCPQAKTGSRDRDEGRQRLWQHHYHYYRAAWHEEGGDFHQIGSARAAASHRQVAQIIEKLKGFDLHEGDDQ